MEEATAEEKELPVGEPIPEAALEEESPIAEEKVVEVVPGVEEEVAAPAPVQVHAAGEESPVEDAAPEVAEKEIVVPEAELVEPSEEQPTDTPLEEDNVVVFEPEMEEAEVVEKEFVAPETEVVGEPATSTPVEDEKTVGVVQEEAPVHETLMEEATAEEKELPIVEPIPEAALQESPIAEKVVEVVPEVEEEVAAPAPTDEEASAEVAEREFIAPEEVEAETSRVGVARSEEAEAQESVEVATAKVTEEASTGEPAESVPSNVGNPLLKTTSRDLSFRGWQPSLGIGGQPIEDVTKVDDVLGQESSTPPAQDKHVEEKVDKAEALVTSTGQYMSMHICASCA